MQDDKALNYGFAFKKTSNNEKQISSFSFEAVIIYMSRSYAGFYEIIAVLFNKKLFP